MNNKIEMHIAIYNPTSELIGIDKAHKGKNCDCRCYSCQGELVAKKGGLNQWHFAHSHNSKKECDYSFWVVCRDLAKQIFSSKNHPLTSMRLSNDIGDTSISHISFDDTSMDDINFDVSFLTKEYGRIYVYFITPEYNRHQFSDNPSFSKNALLIKLKSIEHKKGKVTQELQEIIKEGFNVKKFFDIAKKKIEPTPPVSYFVPKVSLFDEIDQEEKESKKALEIERNTPDFSHYHPHEFRRLLWDPKLEVNTSNFMPKDLECINSLDKIFLQFIAKYGYECNKSFGFKEIANNNKVYFASYYNTFVGYAILDIKFVLFVPKGKTLIPIFSTSFQDSIARKIKPNMLI